MANARRKLSISFPKEHKEVWELLQKHFTNVGDKNHSSVIIEVKVDSPFRDDKKDERSYIWDYRRTKEKEKEKWNAVVKDWWVRRDRRWRHGRRFPADRPVPPLVVLLNTRRRKSLESLRKNAVTTAEEYIRKRRKECDSLVGQRHFGRC